MNKSTKTVTPPVTQPAPQLPNIPASTDNPAQPDIKRKTNTPKPNVPTKNPLSVAPAAPKRPRNADEELPTVL